MRSEDFWDTGFFDKITRFNLEAQEKEAFQRLKEEQKILPVVLIAHPKFKPVIAEARTRGADLTVLWSYYSDDDKIYQVTDPTLRDQIIEITRRQAWQERPV